MFPQPERLREDNPELSHALEIANDAVLSGRSLDFVKAAVRLSSLLQKQHTMKTNINSSFAFAKKMRTVAEPLPTAGEEPFSAINMNERTSGPLESAIAFVEVDRLTSSDSPEEKIVAVGFEKSLELMDSMDYKIAIRYGAYNGRPESRLHVMCVGKYVRLMNEEKLRGTVSDDWIKEISEVMAKHKQEMPHIPEEARDTPAEELDFRIA